MQVHGYNAFGGIDITINGKRMTVPDDPENGHRQMIAVWETEGNTVPEYVAPGPTAHDVDRERDRRIAAGFSFNGIIFQSREADRENIAGAATAALGAIMNGALPGDVQWHGGAGDFAWIAADNTLHTMDAQTVYAFGQAAMAHKQAHIFAARTIKDANPIPNDFADDQWWP